MKRMPKNPCLQGGHVCDAVKRTLAEAEWQGGSNSSLNGQLESMKHHNQDV